MSVPLRDIAAAVPGTTLRGDGGTVVRDLAYDSGAVGHGTLFFCVRGARADGHDYAPAAARAGAVALVVDHPLALGIPQLVVPHVRAAMGPMAALFFGRPSTAIRLVGITGTNGKTTTTFMLEEVLRAASIRSGIIGTVETHIGDVVEPVTRTTPESIDLQRLLAKMRDAGVRGAAMEVSSHGLHQGRVAGTSFTAGVFTNLTQDHLDYHRTMEDYFAAKAALFDPSMSGHAVINIDDAYGRRLLEEITIPATTYGSDPAADVRATAVRLGPDGSDVEVEVAGESVALRVPMPARYNVANALAALATAHILGLGVQDAVRGIAACRGVPGRLERIDAGQDFTVLVDYAHTPDSVEGVLRAAREITSGDARLIVVFGCGGDRDRAKRPLMGRAAASLADHAIITSDNPRSEDPLAIVAEIEAGARGIGSYEVEPDRRSAIGAAVAAARRGDVVVIAGKGHETGQEFADRIVPFDDRIVAREAIEGRRA